MEPNENKGMPKGKHRAGPEILRNEEASSSSSRPVDGPSPSEQPALGPRATSTRTSTRLGTPHPLGNPLSYLPQASLVIPPPPPALPRGSSFAYHRQPASSAEPRPLHQSPTLTSAQAGPTVPPHPVPGRSFEGRQFNRSPSRPVSSSSPRRRVGRSQQRTENQAPPRTPSPSPQRYPPEEVTTPPERRWRRPYDRHSEAYHRTPVPPPQDRASRRASQQRHRAADSRQPRRHHTRAFSPLESAHRQHIAARSGAARRSVAPPEDNQRFSVIPSSLARMRRLFSRMGRNRSPSPPRHRMSSPASMQRSPPRRRPSSSGRRRPRRRAVSVESDASPPVAQAPIQPPLPAAMPAAPYPAVINQPLRLTGFRQTSNGEVHPLYVPMAAVQAEKVEPVVAAAPAADERRARSPPTVHFCGECGEARSEHYHNRNPVAPGSRPRLSLCSRCRRRLSRDEAAASSPLAHAGPAAEPVAGPSNQGNDERPGSEPNNSNNNMGSDAPTNAPSSTASTPAVAPAPGQHHRQDNHTFIVVVEAPNHSHGDDVGRAAGAGPCERCSQRDPSPPPPPRRRRVTFSHPEVTGRYLAHADDEYDRSAVAETVPGRDEEEDDQPGPRHGHTPFRRPRPQDPSPSPGPVFSSPPFVCAPAGAAVSPGGVFSSPNEEEEEDNTPPPEYEPPKVLTMDEIRALWAEPLPQPRRQAAEGPGPASSSRQQEQQPQQEQQQQQYQQQQSQRQYQQQQPTRHYSANFAAGSPSSSPRGGRYQGSQEPGVENQAPDHYTRGGSNSRSDRPRFDSRGNGYPSGSNSNNNSNQQRRSSEQSSSENFFSRSDEEPRRPAFPWSQAMRDRLWVDDDEHARKLRESTERLMRAAREADATRTTSAGNFTGPPSATPVFVEPSSSYMPRPPRSTTSNSSKASSTERPQSPNFNRGYMPHRPSSNHSNENVRPSSARGSNENARPSTSYGDKNIRPAPTSMPTTDYPLPNLDHIPPLNEIPLGQRRCGPECNRFCLHRDDYVEREIVEVAESESDLQSQVSRTRSRASASSSRNQRHNGGPGSSNSSTGGRRRNGGRVFTPYLHPSVSSPRAMPSSPAVSTGSAYFSASSEM